MGQALQNGAGPYSTLVSVHPPGQHTKLATALAALSVAAAVRCSNHARAHLHPLLRGDGVGGLVDEVRRM